MSKQDTPLDAAIAQLYETFASYALNPEMVACPCCVSTEHLDLLKGVPLRRLPYDNLSNFAFNAVTTWGEVEDFKHFFPRLLELELKHGHHFLLDVRSKLEYCSWRTWPAPEQLAIAACYEAAAVSLLSIWPINRHLSKLLDDAVSLGIDMSTFVATWDDLKLQPPAIRHLTELALGWFGHDYVALSPASSATWQQLRSWLLDPATELALVDAYLTGRTGSAEFAREDLERIASAADLLASRRTFPAPGDLPTPQRGVGM